MKVVAYNLVISDRQFCIVSCLPFFPKRLKLVSKYHIDGFGGKFPRSIKLKQSPPLTDECFDSKIRRIVLTQEIVRFVHPFLKPDVPRCKFLI